MKIVFDPLKGELVFVRDEPSIADGRIDFGERSVGDISLDLGSRTNTNSLFDLESRK